MKKLLWIVLILVVLPNILLIAAVKFAATPLTNWLLSKYVNAPSKVEKVSVNWLLTDFVVENLKIYQPEGFGKDVMLSFDRLDLKLQPSTYWKFEPYGNLKVENFYFHYKEKDGINNLSVAFNLPTEPSEEKGEKDFEIRKTLIEASFAGLSDVAYSFEGFFTGYGNDAEFTVKGKGDFSDSSNPRTESDFIVYNWILRSKYLKTLTGKDEIKLTRIEGTVATEEPFIVFVKRNTKAYTVGDVLFAEIYEGSKYNRLTKELDIKGAVYIPAKVEFVITGTTDKPKVEIKNLPKLELNLPSSQLSPQKSGEIQQKVEETLNETVNQIKEKIQKPINELKEELNKLLQGLGQ